MIGLKRNTVAVADHDPSWASRGVVACREIHLACGGLVTEVQHVGSTAVADLPAKPILDLVAGVATLEAIPELTGTLTAIGFVYRGQRGAPGGHIFVRDSEPDVRTTHLHVVVHGGVQWGNFLRFRDLLRGNAAVRLQYADLKLDLARRFPDDRTSYMNAKDEFIRDALNADAPGAGGIGRAARESDAESSSVSRPTDPAASSTSSRR